MGIIAVSVCFTFNNIIYFHFFVNRLSPKLSVLPALFFGYLQKNNSFFRIPFRRFWALFPPRQKAEKTPFFRVSKKSKPANNIFFFRKKQSLFVFSPALPHHALSAQGRAKKEAPSGGRRLLLGSYCQKNVFLRINRTAGRWKRRCGCT